MQRRYKIITIAVLLVLVICLHDYVVYHIIPPWRSYRSLLFGLVGSVPIEEAMIKHVSSTRTGVYLAVEDVGYGDDVDARVRSYSILRSTGQRDYACELLRKVLIEEHVTFGRKAGALRCLWVITRDPRWLVDLFNYSEAAKDKKGEIAELVYRQVRSDLLLELRRIGLAEGIEIVDRIDLTPEQIREAIVQHYKTTSTNTPEG